MDWSNTWAQGTIFAVAGIVAEGLLGWGTSAYFAREAAKDTDEQLRIAERQSRVLTTLLETTEENGLVKMARDAKGEITGGRVIELRGDARLTTSASGGLTTGPPSADRPRRVIDGAENGVVGLSG
jgi:hypothetical protein